MGSEDLDLCAGEGGAVDQRDLLAGGGVGGGGKIQRDLLYLAVEGDGHRIVAAVGAADADHILVVALGLHGGVVGQLAVLIHCVGHIHAVDLHLGVRADIEEHGIHGRGDLGMEGFGGHKRDGADGNTDVIANGIHWALVAGSSLHIGHQRDAHGLLGDVLDVFIPDVVGDLDGGKAAHYGVAGADLLVADKDLLSVFAGDENGMGCLIVDDGGGDEGAILLPLLFPHALDNRPTKYAHQQDHTCCQRQGDHPDQLALGHAAGWQRPQLLEVRGLQEDVLLLHGVHHGIIGTAVLPLGGGQHHAGSAGIAAAAEGRLPLCGGGFRCWFFSGRLLCAGDALFGQAEKGLFSFGFLRHADVGRGCHPGIGFLAQSALKLFAGFFARLELAHLSGQHLAVIR